MVWEEEIKCNHITDTKQGFSFSVFQGTATICTKLNAGTEKFSNSILRKRDVAYTLAVLNSYECYLESTKLPLISQASLFNMYRIPKLENIRKVPFSNAVGMELTSG